MLRKLRHWLVAILVPNHQLVIIAATCELLPIVRPFEPTDLLLVARVLVRDAVLDPQIATNNELVLRASANSRAIPSDGAYPLMMLIQASNLLPMINIPNLCLAVVGANSQMIAFVAPADARDLVLTDNFAQLLYL